MLNNKLTKEHRFVGRVFIRDSWLPAIISLRPDLEVYLFVPMLTPTDEGLPKIVEGQIEDWNIRVVRIARSISHNSFSDFNAIKRKVKLTHGEVSNFGSRYKKMPWRKMTYFPETIAFTMVDSRIETPDEWGITFYPESNNSTLYHLIHEGSEFGRPELPPLFSFVDNCFYFKNKARWSLPRIQKRVDIITTSLSLFAGSPLSYNILIGRREKKVTCIQFHNVLNHDWSKCCRDYNGHAAISDKTFKIFSSSAFTEKIDGMYKHQKQKKALIILRYFRLLYTTPYRESTLAFSFMLMEALAKYRGLPIKNPAIDMKEKFDKLKGRLCDKCSGIVDNTPSIKGSKSDQFDIYIQKAVEVINKKTPGQTRFEYDPKLLKDLARWYRNQVFHGSLFKNMKEIEDKVNKIPDKYRRDLPEVMQSVVSIIGANLILGIDFNLMTGRKRRMYQD